METSRSGTLIRLNKYMAEHGVASRRRCDELIAEGKVTIDGEIVSELGTKIDPTRQRIEIDGRILKAEDVTRQYYLLNKPSGVVCTNDEREFRPRAVDLITARDKGRIYTVGRLDEETVGLVILTSDGDFANMVMHPRYGVSKTYVVKLQGRIDDASVQQVREGVRLSEGKTGGARVLVQKRSPQVSTLLVTLFEGKNREVRRMFAAIGWKVISLRRTRIGTISDRGLKVGHWRPLTRVEVKELLAPPREPRDSGKSVGTRHRARPAARRGARGTEGRRRRS